MRIVSENTQASFDQRTGTEPILILQVNWGGGLAYYSTRSVNFEGVAYCDAKIMSVGELSQTKRADNAANTGNISLTLDDTDGKLKYIISNTRVEKRPAAVYLHFEGNEFADLTLLLKGVVNGPVSWKEGDKTIEFQIEIPQDHNEFGFSPTLDDFPDLSPDAQGVPWPVAFGTVAHVPAVHVKKRVEGTLITDIRLQSQIYVEIRDKNNLLLDLKLDYYPDVYCTLPNPGGVSTVEDKNVIYIWNGENFPQGIQLKILIDNVIFEGTFEGNQFTIFADAQSAAEGVNIPKYTNVKIGGRQDKNDLILVNGKLVNHKDPKTGAIVVNKEYDALWLAASESSKSIVNCWCIFNHQGTADFFNHCESQNKLYCKFISPFMDPAVKNPKTGQLLAKQVLMTSSRVIDYVWPIMPNGMDDTKENLEVIQAIEAFRIVARNSPAPTMLSYAADALRRARANINTFWNRPAGTIVRLYVEGDDDPDLYICNLAPVTQITAVYGRREVHGKKVFTPIPTDYYQVLTSNYQIKGSYVTALAFPTPLVDKSKDNKWDDIVYVSMIGGIGPNISDIIKWCVQRYTFYNIDAPSFAAVRTEVNAYPANFAIYERRDAMKVILDMAWQARCAMLVDSITVSIKHIAKQSGQVGEFDISSIEYRSQVFGFTETQDVFTKMVGVWSSTYKDDPNPTKAHERPTTAIKEIVRSILLQANRENEANQYSIYRENIPIYGVIPEEHKMFIYTDESFVRRSLQFWGHRKANIWQLMTFKTGLWACVLQPFDIIAIDTPLSGLVVAEVSHVGLNFSDRSVTIRVWLPFVAGSHVQDSGAYIDG